MELDRKEKALDLISKDSVAVQRQFGEKSYTYKYIALDPNKQRKDEVKSGR